MQFSEKSLSLWVYIHSRSNAACSWNVAKREIFRRFHKEDTDNWLLTAHTSNSFYAAAPPPSRMVPTS